MANFRLVVVALAALTSLLPAQENTPSTTGGNPVDAAARARGPAVGVVDIDKAIDQYPKAIAEREKLAQLQQSFQTQIDEMTKRIDQLRAEMSLLKEGSREREVKELDLGLAMEQRKGLATVFKNEMDRARDKYYLIIYPEIEAAVAQVAKDRGVQIVLRLMAQEPIEEGAKDSMNAQQVRLLTYTRRSVWFAAEEADLTPAVIKYLKVPVDLNKGEPKKDGAPPAPKPPGNGGE